MTALQKRSRPGDGREACPRGSVGAFKSNMQVSRHVSDNSPRQEFYAQQAGRRGAHRANKERQLREAVFGILQVGAIAAVAPAVHAPPPATAAAAVVVSAAAAVAATGAAAAAHSDCDAARFLAMSQRGCEVPCRQRLSARRSSSPLATLARWSSPKTSTSRSCSRRQMTTQTATQKKPARSSEETFAWRSEEQARRFSWPRPRL
eukprot:6190305-Pleurochrysis_carterae.AAC.2